MCLPSPTEKDASRKGGGMKPHQKQPPYPKKGCKKVGMQDLLDTPVATDCSIPVIEGGEHRKQSRQAAARRCMAIHVRSIS